MTTFDSGCVDGAPFLMPSSAYTQTQETDKRRKKIKNSTCIVSQIIVLFLFLFVCVPVCVCTGVTVSDDANVVSSDFLHHRHNNNNRLVFVCPQNEFQKFFLLNFSRVWLFFFYFLRGDTDKRIKVLIV